ncbi:perlucin-like [Anoplophora glabripennis]|uniref:perlucin-like n=1 Tax=Anoplophora glabripennis TaxID=217634 RepID=UPI000874A283|nr:perlucin-like [Anoplophora glabripennis]
MLAGKSVVKIIHLHVIFVFFFGCCASDCVNKTGIHQDLAKASIGEALPDVPLEKFGNKYYYFGAIYEGNYFQAIQYCNYHRMTLLSIETKEENDFLFERFRHFLGWGTYHFWTSGTTLPDAHWVWLSTGRPVLFANWSPNQPDNSGNNESCIEAVYVHTNKALVWNDHVCALPKHVICETLDVKCAA